MPFNILKELDRTNELKRRPVKFDYLSLPPTSCQSGKLPDYGEQNIDVGDTIAGNDDEQITFRKRN